MKVLRCSLVLAGLLLIAYTGQAAAGTVEQVAGLLGVAAFAGYSMRDHR